MTFFKNLINKLFTNSNLINLQEEDDTDLVSIEEEYCLQDLDTELIVFIYPRLVAFKEHTKGHPPTLTEKQWMEKLDLMIKAFEYLNSEERWHDLEEPEYVQRGLKTFARWFNYLWY